MRVIAEGIIDAEILAQYFCSTEESSKSTPIVNLIELRHLIQVSYVNAQSWRALNAAKERFKELDAYWLLFSYVTDYYETTTLTDDDDGKSIITVNQ